MRYFCPSAIFGYLGGQPGDKMGDNLQISKLKVKNLQKWAQFLMLEIKRFTIHICRYYAFLCKKSLSHAEILENIPKNFVAGDFSCDFSKGLDTVSEVFCKEISRQLTVHPFLYSFNGFSCPA